MKPNYEAKAPSLSSDRRIDESGRSKKGFKASFLMPGKGGGGAHSCRGRRNRGGRRRQSISLINPLLFLLFFFPADDLGDDGVRSFAGAKEEEEDAYSEKCGKSPNIHIFLPWMFKPGRSWANPKARVDDSAAEGSGGVSWIHSSSSSPSTSSSPFWHPRGLSGKGGEGKKLSWGISRICVLEEGGYQLLAPKSANPPSPPPIFGWPPARPVSDNL